MRILIVGAAGKLGSALMQRLDFEHDTIGADLVGDAQQVMDICDYAACRRLVDATAPDIVLHAAAWTDVDGCALDPKKAMLINGVGAHNVAAASALGDIPILYVSTNEVFDGQLRRPYHEHDRAAPKNAYGRSKWYGERAVAAINPKHYIARTAWLFAQGGGNFAHAILSAAEAGKALRVVINEVANPTFTEDLADAIGQLIMTERYGTYHLVNEGAVSRWGLARHILDRAGYADTPIEQITLSQWQRASQPPEYAALENIAGASLGIRLRSWQEAVDAFLSTRTAGQ